MSKGKKKRKNVLPMGLTLIEVMAAMVILGLVMIIAIPNFQGEINQTKDNAEQVNQQLLTGAINQFKLDTGIYPADLAYLLANPGTGIPGWAGPYLESLPQSTGGRQYDIDQNTGAVILK